MKTERLLDSAALLLGIVLVGVVLHAPLTVFLGTLLPDYDLLIKSWKEILLGAATVLLAIHVTRRRLWSWLLDDTVIRLAAAFAGLHAFLAAVLFTGWMPTLAGLLIDLRYVLMFVLLYTLLRITPHRRAYYVQWALVGAGIVVGFAALQLVLPKDILASIGYGPDTIWPYMTVDKNPDYIRINSTLRGPNPLGAFAAIVVAVSAAWLMQSRQKVKAVRLCAGMFLALGLLALWNSHSRGAWLAAIVSGGVIAGAALIHKYGKKVWIICGLLLVAAAGILYMLRDSAFIATVVLHDSPTTGAAVDSNSEHIQSLADGTARMLAQPLGGGIGSTGSASLYGDAPLIIENQYLYVAHEAGWLGLGLFIALFTLVLWRVWQWRADWLALGVFASGIGLAVTGLFLPVWADDTVGIFWWALAAIALTKEASGGKQTKQKAA